MELRHELREWLSAYVTPEVVKAGRRPVAEESLDTLRAWNRRLADAGWAAPTWPVEHGGRAADVDEQVACYEEMDAAQAPGPINAIGVANIAPAIMAFGSDEQRGRFLRPMLRGDEIWSQGMSEPDSGSDLASLRTLAEPTVPGSSSTGRRPGTALATSPTGASCTSGPTPRFPSTVASAACSSTSAARASRLGPCAR
jgi:alkylation response protein AidB-like acyl-CoA dehydrogenase